jgi:flagellar biosynthesis/type III secretory pathway protein FliH
MAALIWTGLPGPAAADTVILNNGRAMSGTVQSLGTDQISLTFAGAKITINRDQIKEIVQNTKTSGPIPVTVARPKPAQPSSDVPLTEEEQAAQAATAADEAAAKDAESKAQEAVRQEAAAKKAEAEALAKKAADDEATLAARVVEAEANRQQQILDNYNNLNYTYGPNSVAPVDSEKIKQEIAAETPKP